MTWEEGGTVTADPGQVVLASEPYRRLSYTWHSLTPDWAKTVGLSHDVYARLADEGRSKVTFEIEPLGALTKLTVVHDDFDEGSVLHSMLSQGWPGLLSSLKTLLETGEPLPKPERAAQGR
ncbi:SRPBCC domain-containing protein [Saccharomonospora iraqiensis]|uniref:SRPBCC domain-containing protein n=1 Tax=Saccharomonospora iraqiensis TaxID=52698 RepID=UPI00022DF119